MNSKMNLIKSAERKESSKFNIEQTDSSPKDKNHRKSVQDITQMLEKKVQPSESVEFANKAKKKKGNKYK
eukprot:CAMPEP_0116991062 /NCGR_PEP_ID=MMETSP0467-20121206/65893_1 /TAXON_ID=283647 /ORGANISM="Mesodinium pulex, Strain SPMC105" /LENGTH=69 /DNA_ID=CAMNT_0004688031 /DNA_START=1135 /DNA_END=1344 /DNA_ORIENTATION=-